MNPLARVACVIALSSGLATGCVTSGTHEALQKKYDDCTTRGTELEQALEAERKMVAQLTSEKAEVAARLDKAQQEKASLLSDQSQLEASIQQMQLALAELERRKAEADARVAEFRSLLDRFKPLMDAGKLRVRIVDGRMVVQMATDVLFGSGSAKLSDEGQTAVAEVAGLLASLEGKRFQIEGHTDNVPIKTARYPSNWELAAGRALTVVKTMIEAGLDAARVSGASYGEFKPVADNETPEGRSENRRIEIVVVPDLSTLPGFDELQKLGTEQASL
jgi:chemotaxis protein MotB